MGLFFLCLLSFPAASYADQGAPPAVWAAARNGLPGYLRALPEDALLDYGFTSPQELPHAQLGQPYRVHILTADGLQKAAAQHIVEPFLMSTDTWVFPVLVDQQPRTLLWVDRMPEGYRAVQLGNTILAQLLAGWETRLPDLLRQQDRGSFQLRLVQMPQLLTDLLLLSSPKAEYIAPLHVSPELADAFSQDNLSPADHALSVLYNRFSGLRSEPAGGFAPAGGSTATGQPGQPTSVAAMVVAIALIVTASACLWHHRRGQREGAP